MQRKLKDLLYRYVLGKDRLQLQKEAREQGYAQGYNDAENIYKERQVLLEREWFVDPFTVFSVNPQGRLYIGTQEVSDAEVRSIQEEIKFFDKTRLWQIFQGTIRQKAIDKSVIGSSTWEEVLAGKMMIHNLGVMQSILNVIKSHKTK